MSEAVVGRRTPYEAVFGGEGFEAGHFPAIVEEADSRGLAPERREEFALLARVGAAMQEMVPDGVEPAAIGPYVDALFHAFHFWRSGHVVYALEREVGVSLVEAPPATEAARPRVPADCLYLELPARLFWGQVAGGEPPEPLEGMFVRAEADADDRLAGADLLLVFGMHPRRAGFSSVPVELGRRELEAAVPEGAFRSRIPGADLAGLYSIERRREASLLLTRALEYIERHPEAVLVEDALPESDADPGGRTALGFHRVRPVGRIGR